MKSSQSPAGAYELDFGRDPSILSLVPSLEGLAIFTVDARVRFVGWSAGAERLTGYSAAAVRGERCELLDGAHCRGFHGLAAMIADPPDDAETVESNQCRLVRADGRETTVLGTARLCRDSQGVVYGALCVLVDLSDVLDGNAAATPAPSAATEGELVGSSRAMHEVFRKIQVAAASDVSAVITGESGTGKELCARAIHSASARKSRPFVAVNCAAIPEALLESELFGHARGAFTGADTARDGLFLAADGGTLFLDEVAELPVNLQAKLLRVLQERRVQRVGETTETPIDVRLITATHRDLALELQEGRMREDFYYRFYVFEIHIPPLRERPEDIPVLAQHLGKSLARQHGRPFQGLSVDALEVLIRHRWPGNVRELRNVIEHALVVASSPILGVFELPASLRGDAFGGSGATLEQPLTPTQEAEKVHVLDALDAHAWNRTRAAEALGVSRVTLWKKMRRYRIDEGVFRRGTRSQRQRTET